MTIRWVTIPLPLQPTAVAAAAGAGKDKVSFDYLKLCLETIGQRAETLQDIKEGFPAYLVRARLSLWLLCARDMTVCA